MFNLDFNLKKFYEYIKTDLVMSKITKKFRGLNNLTTATVFEGLASSIIEQQISFKAAQSIERHMIRDHGEELHLRWGGLLRIPHSRVFIKTNQRETA